MPQIDLTDAEMGQLNAMLADWLQANGAEGITPLVQAVCDKTGVSTDLDVLGVLYTSQPMRANHG